jgi:hypothetical protein
MYVELNHVISVFIHTHNGGTFSLLYRSQAPAALQFFFFYIKRSKTMTNCRSPRNSDQTKLTDSNEIRYSKPTLHFCRAVKVQLQVAFLYSQSILLRTSLVLSQILAEKKKYCSSSL